MGVLESPTGSALTPGQRLGRFVMVSVLAGAIVAAMGIPAVASLAFATKTAAAQFEALPQDVKSLPLPQHSYLTAANGERIATLYKEDRIVVPLDSISDNLKEAMIATEDARFFEHNGVDLKGAFRALVANSSAGGVQQGSSTITMQYVRNLLITGADSAEEVEAARVRSLDRKIQEMRYALALEKRLTKDQILAGYLNIVYFGAGAYGAEAAAKRFFSKSASKLNLNEAATLAGLTQNPTSYDPLVNPKAAQTRRDMVLDRMVAENYITADQAAKVKRQSVKKLLDPSRPDNGCPASEYPFYCDYVLAQIRNDPRYGATVEEREDFVRSGGLVIQTTLDVQAQNAAQQAVNRYLPPTDSSRKAAAIAMVEPGTGHVLALAQNREWGTSGLGKTTYNYAVNAADGGTVGMQAGSTFKIFTLAAALENGMNPTEVISGPQRTTFYDTNWGCKPGDKGYSGHPPYTVNNSTGSGAFNMWSGTARSINTYFVELQRRAGLCNTVDMAERMGVTLANGEDLPRFPSFTLGSMEVSPLALANAYATAAAHGRYCAPMAITRIADFGDNTLYSNSSECTRAMSRGTADAVTAILTGVVDGSDGGRTGRAMSLGRDAAGKTGTTDSNAAVWFAGYTPEIAAAVWAGDPRGGFRYPMQNVVINGQFYSRVHGSSLPGPIWREAMSGALAGTSASSFDLDAKFGLTTARRGGVNRLWVTNTQSSTGTEFTSPGQGSSTGPNRTPSPAPNPYYTRPDNPLLDLDFDRPRPARPDRGQSDRSPSTTGD